MQIRIVHLLVVLSIGYSVGALAQEFRSDSDFLVLKPRDDAEVHLSGTSTLHQWDCKARELQGALLTNVSYSALGETVTAYLDGRVPNRPDGGEMHIWLEVRPENLDCDNRRMHRDLNRAVKADTYPQIEYWFTGIEGTPEMVDSEGAPALRIRVFGELSLAGETRELAHDATIRLLDRGVLEASGELELHMADFGIEPPTALLGLIRAHPEFTVRYRLEIPLEDQRIAPSEMLRLAEKIWDTP